MFTQGAVCLSPWSLKSLMVPLHLNILLFFGSAGVEPQNCNTHTQKSPKWMHISIDCFSIYLVSAFHTLGISMAARDVAAFLQNARLPNEMYNRQYTGGLCFRQPPSVSHAEPWDLMSIHLKPVISLTVV